MKHLLGIVGGLFLLSVLGCGPGDEAADTSSPFDSDTGTIIDTDTGSETLTDGMTGLVVGKVLLQGQSEHSGIEVVVNGLTGFLDQTDLTGAFEIAHVPVGNYTVTASLAGYDEQQSDPFSVFPGETVIVPAFTLLEATGGLQGYAYLKDATDHSGTIVTLQGTTHSATTDATGFWTIDNVPASNYTVIASHSTYFDEEKSDQEVTGGGSLTVSDISLTKKERGSIIGVVTLTGQTEHAEVTIVATNEAAPTTTVSTITNGSGAYHLTNLEAGVYRMEAYKAEFQSITMEEIAVPADGEVAVDYSLNKSPPNALSRVAYVSGGSNNGDAEQEGILGTALAQPLVVQLQDSYGTPMVDRFVTAVVTNAQNGGHVEQQTLLSDAEGRVAFTYLLGGTPGQNRIVVKSNDISESRVIFTAIGVNTCGDGFVLDGEQCDDGNTINTDGCANTCLGDAQCGGVVDFTACDVVTYPDRDYDICIRNYCRSPGCGDAICNVPGPHFPLADTNQRKCYNDTVEMAFPANDTDPFYGQDAQYGWDTANASTARFTRNLSVSGNPVVTDTVTGLVWQGCAFGYSGDDCGTDGATTTFVWTDALAQCDSLSWGGFTDWRLPDEFELSSIVDLGMYTPSIDTAAFPATPVDCFWSSSSMESSISWGVCFDQGTAAWFSNWDLYNVRCVRSIPIPQPARFVRDTSQANEPTVVDNATVLEWQGCAKGLTGDNCGVGSATGSGWSAALSCCEGLSWADHDDWRLPDSMELQSLVEYGRIEATAFLSIDTTAFPATPGDHFWSSSSYADAPSSAWSVSFDNGYGGCWGKSNAWYVRCVRYGP